nr:hypothetical protein JVH1_5622 [Rhodococcus sp. JVH1]
MDNDWREDFMLWTLELLHDRRERRDRGRQLPSDNPDTHTTDATSDE